MDSDRKPSQASQEIDAVARVVRAAHDYWWSELEGFTTPDGKSRLDIRMEFSNAMHDYRHVFGLSGSTEDKGHGDFEISPDSNV